MGTARSTAIDQSREQSLQFPAEASRRLTDLCRAETVDPFIPFIAAFQMSLCRYFGLTDAVLRISTSQQTESGPPVSACLRSESFGVLAGGALTFRHFVTIVQTAVHRDPGLAALVQSKSMSSPAPLSLRQIIRPDRGSETGHSREPGPPTRELIFAIGPAEACLEMAFAPTPHLMEGLDVAWIATHLERLLLAGSEMPDSQIRELDLPDADERDHVLFVSTGISQAYPSICAHELIREQGRNSPLAVALVNDGHKLSYRDLNLRAARLGNHLRELGVKRGMPVGIYLHRSVEAITAILAILKAGGAYVPLDPTYPHDRIAFMIHDAGVSLIITNDALRRNLSDPSLTIVCPDTLQQLHSDPGEDTDARVTLDDIAFISYTSGSSGTPKGVVHTHRHLVHRMPQMEPGDVCAINVSLSFGFSLARLFPPLFRGLTLVIISEEDLKDPRRLIATIEREAISNIGLVPSALGQLLEFARSAPVRVQSIRTVTVSGAAVSADLLSCFRSILPQARLFYGYGASEVGPVTLHEVTATPAGTSRTVGRPLANTQVLILDCDQRLLPTGAVGEIYIGARHLAAQYLNQPALTKERFIPNPFASEVSGPLMYRTGDLGRYCDDGQLQLLGRRDNQVKIRGFRVDLEEVEAALCTQPDIRDAAVAAHQTGEDLSLITYVVTKPHAIPRISELRAHLQKLLPDHMIPSLFMILEELPLTATGKLDRDRLPVPGPNRPQIDTPDARPRTRLEQEIAAIWSEVLGIQQIGIYDHFLELGADSLTIARLASRMSEHLGISIQIMSMFEKPTIAEIAVDAAWSPDDL